MGKKTVTNSRVRNSLRSHFKEFLDSEKIPEQINQKIQEHSIKKGVVREVYHYLDISLVELSDNTKVEAYHLHRTLGNIVDLFTPIGEQVISERKHEPCIIPRFQLKCLVAEVGKDEYVLLGFYNPNMEGSYSPAENGHYIIKTVNDGFQAGLDISSDNIGIISHTGASFVEANVGENTTIDYANSKDIYTKDEVYKKSQTYNKTQIDDLIQAIWDYIRPEDDGDD